MIKLVIPLVLGLIGAGAGIGAGLMLKPAPEPAMEEGMAKDVTAKSDAAKDVAGEKDEEASGEAEAIFVKLNNQFIIPVIEGGQIVSMVVLSLSLETRAGGQEIIFQREPKLRDSFLQVLFDHANSGGFSGAFTGGARLDQLRTALQRAAQRDIGDYAVGVLVTDLARQDV